MQQPESTFSALALTASRHKLTRRRYQRGSLIDNELRSRWEARWLEDVVAPSGAIDRVHRWTVLGTKKQLPTKRMAQRELDRILEPINSASYRPSVGRVKFSAYAETWKKEMLMHFKPSTQHGYVSIIRVHLLPSFGALDLANISAELVQAFVNEWALSPPALQNAIKLMTRMWDDAEAWNYVEHTPFPRNRRGKPLLRMPRMVRGKTYNYSLEETLAIIDRATGKYKLMFRAFAETGMRPGEMSGMRRSDLSGRVISLSQSAYHSHLHTPKTANGIRQFPISRQLADNLRDHIEATKGDPNNHDLMFPNQAGNPMDMGEVIRVVLNPLLDQLGIRAKLDALGVRKAGLYPLRHMNITELRRSNVPLKTVQKRVGHATGSRITDEFYFHTNDEDDLAAADLLGELLSPARGERHIKKPHLLIRMSGEALVSG